jgi:glutamyl-tRNA synthetase
VPRDFVINAPLHPEHPEMGTRTLKVQAEDGVAKVLLAGTDRQLVSSAKMVRLMGLFNFKPGKLSGDELSGEFLGEGIVEGEHAPVLQWVPRDENLTVDVVMPDTRVQRGLAEKGLNSEKVGSIIQFVRFGFGRIDNITDERITVYFAHQ